MAKMRKGPVNTVVEEAAEFSQMVLRPRARETDEEGMLPRELIREMGERGYLGATMPDKHGGL